ncbi:MULTISPECIES: hypothetical protein [Microbacterium]|uniref:hypothetical protein n=1 Tax=Microbacterium TaxID=33882 RepID=UPI00217EBEFE|nr:MULTISPECIES: hypothetical protein [Microbacterium]UWF77270.1 hypothetical protein JSY13_10860 [Microbacterium neungamense]WCM55427.1 hypothetical protein JRG78_10855 [Microbacterium sp. EF45047]
MAQTQITPAARTAPPVTSLRTFFISGLGTALEFYDFIIYGFAASLVFPQLFFPDVDPLMGTIVAFAAFGAGFVARPLGGIVVGHFGDRIGRKAMLVLTLLVMGVSTFLMASLSDRIGRKKVLIGGAIVYGLFFFAFLGILDLHDLPDRRRTGRRHRRAGRHGAVHGQRPGLPGRRPVLERRLSPPHPVRLRPARDLPHPDGAARRALSLAPETTAAACFPGMRPP